MTIRSRQQQRGQALNGGNWYGQWGDPSVIPPNSAYNKSAAGVVVNERSTLSLMTVFSCIRVLADSIAGLDTHAYVKVRNDRGGLEEEEVPLPRVVEDPYADVDPYDGDFKAVAAWGLNGNHFLHVVDRDNRGNPMQVEILNPSSVRVERVKGVKTFRMGAVGALIDPDDIVHIPWVSLAGGDVGMNPIEIGSMGIGIALASEEYAARWFAQGAQPTGLLSVEKPLTKADALRLKMELMTDHGGLSNAHLPLVLDSNTKWTQIGVSAEASQLLQTREFSRTELTGFYGVPPHLVGDTSDKGMVWGRGLQEMVISFSMFTLQGYAKRHQRAWTRLCPVGGGAYGAGQVGNVYVRKNLGDLYKTNDTMVAQLINALRITATVTPNEARGMVGRKRVDDPAADSLFAPLNSSPTDWYAQMQELGTPGTPGGSPNDVDPGDSGNGMGGGGTPG